MNWVEIGDKFRFVEADIEHIYEVTELIIQYQCELGPESLVKLVYDIDLFDPMLIRMDVLNRIIELKIFEKV